MHEFRMPSLGADMEAGTLTKWTVKAGDAIKRGDTIAVVETDKANVDVEVFEAGIIDRLVAQPGEKLPVGAVLAYIRAEGEAAAPPARERIAASPLARKLAREYGLDLTRIHGTGPHGVVEAADVERARKPAAAPVPAAEIPAAPHAALTGMRRAIAAAMARSNREIPHYYLQTRIDMHAALEHLAALNAQRSIADRILPAALLLKATALALTDVPELNGYWIDDAPHVKDSVHLGIAISLRGGGLVIPAIHDTGMKTLDEIMQSMRDVITRARAGSLKSSELTDATITVTNLGDLGVEAVYGVIYPPQLALVGFGKIAEMPWARDGMLGIRPIVTATLAADHRATDGHRGAQFLTALDRRLQEAEKL
jgi:pyruvate dehydrogenase E2 component (dihydrolipoamide acetyltransferase)